jgi:hypothetical protein
MLSIRLLLGKLRATDIQESLLLSLVNGMNIRINACFVSLYRSRFSRCYLKSNFVDTLLMRLGAFFSQLISYDILFFAIRKPSFDSISLDHS